MDLNVSLMHAPLYTALAAAFLVLLNLVLIARVIMTRGKLEVMIGDGGKDAMHQVIRVHGNLVENAPIFLVALALLELLVGSTLWVGVIAGVFVVSRIAHAIGFSMNISVSPGRFLGTVGTLLSLLVTALYLGYIVFTRL